MLFEIMRIWFVHYVFLLKLDFLSKLNYLLLQINEFCKISIFLSKTLSLSSLKHLEKLLANIFSLFCRLLKCSIANFTLPDEGTESPFKEITFVELQREEASKLVEKYNKVR